MNSLFSIRFFFQKDFCRIQVSDPHQNRTIHVGRILESDISIIPEFSQCVDIVFLSDTSIRPTSKPNNLCRSDSRIRHSNHSRKSVLLSDTSIRPTSLITATAGRLGMKQCVILCPHLYRIPILPILRYSGY